MMTRVIAAAACIGAATGASADVLWDQSSFAGGAGSGGVFNVNTGGPPFGLEVYSVTDVTVGADGWVIESITTFYDGIFSDASLVTAANLHIFPKTGTLPTAGDDPSASVELPASAVDVGGVIEVTVSGLSESLGAGDYWVGITPIALGGGPFGGFEGIQLVADMPIGDPSASYDAFPASWATTSGPAGPADGAILIEGVVPAPASAALIGLAGAMTLRRRR